MVEVVLGKEVNKKIATMSLSNQYSPKKSSRYERIYYGTSFGRDSFSAIRSITNLVGLSNGC